MVKETGKYTCCHCGKSLSHSAFNAACSTLYKETGHLPICKQCIIEMYKEYYNKYKSAKKAIQRICMAFDLYYDNSVFKSCSNDDETAIIGNYIKRLNMFQYRNKTFDNTLEGSFNFNKIKEIKEKEQSDKQEEEPDETSIERWGTGFSKIDYDILNSHYKLLKESNPNSDNNQEIFINDLCYIKMQQMKAAREGHVDDFNKLTDSYRKSFKEAGLKTNQAINVGEGDCYGEWNKRIEQYTPSEYYKNKTLYKDFDGLGNYFERHIERPMKNLQHGTNVRDSEYSVGDENATE